jgi:para-nitrobenzyl esterase
MGEIWRGILCALLIFPFSISGAKAETRPTVAVTGGQIRGRLLVGNVGAVLRGIPYAQPPVGDLRWREPAPVTAWKGMRGASEPPPPCAQPSLGWNNKFAAASSEDCLYLDVWTPEWPPRLRKPVMVWIHGGANIAGAGGFDPLYDGRAMIRHGVVLVTIQYRLGIFGFFAHRLLTEESPHHSSGNYGILDQIAALHWVHDNIAKFGGDPGNVSVFGQSAGSIDALLLMTSPLAKGLFEHVIGESGPLPIQTPTLAEAEESGTRTAQKLKVPSEGALRYLRSLPAAELLKSGGPGLAMTNVDGWVFPESPHHVLVSGKGLRIPLIIGSNAIEFPASGAPDELRKRLETEYKDLAPKALELYGLGPDRKDIDDPLYGNLGDQVGSDALRCAVVVDGEWHSMAGGPTWEYQFDRAIPPRPHTAHSGELPYVFGNLYAQGSQAGEFEKADRELSAIMQTYWTNFAKDGDPNGGAVPVWPKFDSQSRKYIEFTSAAGVKTSENQRGLFCDLLRESLHISKR